MAQPFIVSESKATPKEILERVGRRSPKELPSQVANDPPVKVEVVTPVQEVTPEVSSPLPPQTLLEMEAGRKNIEKYKAA